MNELQQQILELNHKMDVLYEVVGQLKNQFGEFSSHYNLQETPPSSPSPLHSLRAPVVTSPRSLNEVLDHKDILVEGNSWHYEHHSVSEPTISCDLQVRRLTAQLTAAYNRIAALEEQLLARHPHSIEH